MSANRVLLIIFDGIGMNPSRKYHAWAQSRAPHLDDYLISDGGVHSHIAHLLDLLPMVVKAGVEPVIHMITDGRDTAPKSA
ncbi:MAG: hypothetical protein V3W04_04375 [Gammaproteobacteria bacterium]